MLGILEKTSLENIEVLIKVFGLMLTVIVTIYGYRRYNYIVKQKNRKLQLNSSELELIKKSISYITKALILNIIAQYSISRLYEKIVGVSLAFLSIMVSILIIFMSLTMYIILKQINEKKLFDKYKEKTSKFKKNIYVYLIPILIATINILLLITLIAMTFFFFKRESRDIKSIRQYIESSLIIYTYWMSFNMIIYRKIRLDLQRDMDEVKIFYNQNGETKVAFNIDYNELIIEKDFIVFYSKKEKCKNLIQSKDLLKIQYYYNDLS